MPAGRPPIRDDKKEQIIEATRMGIPVKIIAECLGLAETTVYKYQEGEGEAKRLKTIIEVMETLARNRPDEFLKRFDGKKEFTSIDKADVAIHARDDTQIIINFINDD